ncbi:MAG: carbohydrate kinase family protein [Immundisolibacter sp.]|uniref:carbohydrate kinase family protein n=1 Tax=Immundisolibacter sp. TaxID=1934948 RepID=UPI003EE0AE2D
MRALICGSMAYDTIMVFQDRFKNHILPDQVHILNVSFLVPQMRREFGGCAGNIAYNLSLLGSEPLPMATVGEDFGPYQDWLDKHGIDRRHITQVAGSFTGQAFITTDLDDNQITAFHPGAMSESHRNSLTDVDEVDIGIVAPDGRDGMLLHSREFAEAGVPFIFDPGQGLPMFDKAELLTFIDEATWITVNDYEIELLQSRTELSAGDIAKRVEALIVTRGGKGSNIYTGGHRIDIPPVKTATVNDPTGCGDAYRAGLLHGLMHELDWPITGRIASLMGAIKIEQHGTQNHYFTREAFEQRFVAEFGHGF